MGIFNKEEEKALSHARGRIETLKAVNDSLKRDVHNLRKEIQQLRNKKAVAEYKEKFPPGTEFDYLGQHCRAVAYFIKNDEIQLTAEYLHGGRFHIFYISGDNLTALINNGRKKS